MDCETVIKLGESSVGKILDLHFWKSPDPRKAGHVKYTSGHDKHTSVIAVLLQGARSRDKKIQGAHRSGSLA